MSEPSSASWKMVELTADQVARDEHDQLQEDFAVAYIGAGWPEGAAMFGGAEGAGWRIWLSPGAVGIAGPLLDAAGATDSDPPPPGCRLLVGRAPAEPPAGPPAPPAADSSPVLDVSDAPADPDPAPASSGLPPPPRRRRRGRRF